MKDELNSQLQMALAINLGLNGPQEAKERALHNVMTSKSARGDLKQVLQSRAEIYGDALDPNWFKPGTDIAAKTKSLRERNSARSQLAGAPLLVSQLGAMEFRDRMIKGDATVLKTLRLGTQTTVAETLKKLGQAPPVAVLELCYGRKQFDFVASMLQHADDLDFVQDVLSATGSSNKINPILNGVIAGFNRRRRHQKFKLGHYNMELDRLRYAETATQLDSDLAVKEVESKNEKSSQTSGQKR